MIDLPAPLTPADCDLRDFAFMPLDVARLRRSKAWLKAKRNPVLAFYLINLWTASWHDMPAASLENDDDVLADLAMCEPGKWAKIKADVLYGWVECSDGRLYHPTVAEKAVEAWEAKQAQRQRTEAARLAKEQKRIATQQLLSQTLQAASVTGSVTEAATGSKGEGQGEGQGDLYSVPYGTGGAAAGKRERTPEENRKSELWRAIKALLVDSGESKDLKAAGAVVTKAITRFDEPTALAAIEATLHARPAGVIAYLEGACQQASGQRQNKQEALEAGNLAAAERFAQE